MKKIFIEYETKNKIDIIIENSNEFNIFNEFDFSIYDKLILFYDKNVHEIYSETIENSIKKKNIKIEKFILESKESSKSITFYPVLVDFLEDIKTSRSDLVIAIGGGIVIDAISFTISTYMRGIDLYIIGTTLIGQTDASTAGKTSMNTENGKNVLGTFYYPKVVYNNIKFLETNLPLYNRQGLSESLKYGLLNNKLLTDLVLEYSATEEKKVLELIVIETIKSRVNIRKIDPLASNLGHTFGHALESYFNYEILHGDAISIGMILAINFSRTVGIMSESTCNQISEMIKKAGLNITIQNNMDIKRLVNLMSKDKKSSEKFLNLVLLRNIGELFINNNVPFYTVEYSVVEIFLETFLENYKHKTNNLVAHLKRDYL